jgi:N-acetylglucosamine kinase-like BadF-type ATPase
MKSYYLGVDGGQSSTTALIADETGRVIGRGRGGPCNHVSTVEGREKFFSAVGSCLEQACQQAGLDASTVSFAAVCLGLSGGAEDKDAYARELIRSRRYKITHDAEIALAGATAGEPGIVVIAGTGSIAFGWNAKNETARAGGWGYIFGDEGGAFDLTKRALRAALAFEEGWGPETVLYRLLLAETGAASANQLMRRWYSAFDRSAVAAFAELVARAAEGKDAVALKILDEAAEFLTWYIQGVYQRLFTASEIVPVAHIGGVFQSAHLREKLTQNVLLAIGCPVGASRFSPVAGALLEALRLDGNRNQPFDPAEQ